VLLRLLSVGTLAPGVLDALVYSVASVMPCEVEDGPAIALPGDPQKTDQMDAREMAVLLPKGRCDILNLGITDFDITVPGYNFVFGYAVPTEHRGVVSLKRLHGSREENAAFDVMLIERATKEVLHEAGHLLGLQHCPNAVCVMRYSQTLHDTDLKSERFCPRCARELSRLPECSHEG